MGPRITLIGAQESTDADYLYKVRGVVVTGGGTIAVANGGDNTIRLYAEDGSMLRSAGGAGHGPGEFQTLWSIHRYRGDSLAAFDFTLRRVSVYSETLEFVRSFQLPDIGLVSALYLVGSDQYGTWYFFEDLKQLDTQDLTANGHSLHHTDGTLWALHDRDEDRPIEIGSYTGTQVFLSTGGGTMRVDVPIFGIVSVVGITSRSIVTVDSAGQQVQIRDLKGNLTASARSVASGLPVTRQDRELFVESQLALATSDERRRSLRDTYRAMPTPAILPEFGRAVRSGSHPNVISAGDTLIVRRYDRGDGGNVVWYAMDSTAETWGWLRLPRSFNLLAIRENIVAGISIQDDGVETVVVSVLVPT
jgi:hypothetical protein